jgi:hypothetical protein
MFYTYNLKLAICVAKKAIDNLKFRRMRYKKQRTHQNKLLCVIVCFG